ncbi:hypothetical protein [Vagococcus lutrae]|uniref:Uncharacterized protein n=2 Tax=Vagococcus lutrae TaxID=81947 RepID=V6QBS4_9ENTE|nr:hypothetical protein [Vagococcus lutrae]EST90028.1 hypothetical protein T233_00926 [Vagococcus lutrae LBD1]MDT2806335.1 hypothetical protein [Vagococcus lutrae]MDT2817150.1 hypothetical protein [Vagococcus lutrae]MDT2824587.1 hypothetical protein [Vagococcus lutrae]MDT2825137.1 hypothetical protein [Vagococcus lutrae]
MVQSWREWSYKLGYVCGKFVSFYPSQIKKTWVKMTEKTTVVTRK